LETHAVGKQHTQKIERQPLPWRTRRKRFARKPIGCSQSIMLQAIVLRRFMNREEFALPI
jgi:insertion element IS1 protein InsB